MKKPAEKRILTCLLSMMIVLSTACAAPIAEPATNVAASAAAPPAVAAVAATPALSAEEAVQRQLCDEIISKADVRREAILNAPTNVTVAGTSYYVSLDGDDGNDGLSPETPWRTAAKVNETDLQPGDGVFYLRCDEGSPGALYEEIEFSTGWGLNVGGGATVDNLCVSYVGNCGVMSDPESPLGITVQNMEVGFMGDIYIAFEQADCHGVGGGEGFGFNGYGSVCRNNYVHDGRDGSFTVELGWDATVQDGQSKMGGLTATGNLFARSNGGIGIINFLEEDAPIEISDILIDDNYFINIGYRNVLFDGVEENVACIHVWFAGDWDDLKGVTISNNTFFLAAPKLINLLNIGEAELDFEGNTYVQDKYQRAFTYAPTYDSEQNISAADEAAFKAAVHDLLGDNTGTAHTITLGLDHAEANRARSLGLVPGNAPEDLSKQITEREMVDLLTGFVQYTSPEKLADWQTVSDAAAGSDYPMNQADGAIALFEAAKALDWNVAASDKGWQNFDRINASQGNAWNEIDCANLDIWPNTQETGIDPNNPSLCLYHLALLYSFGKHYNSTNSYLLNYDAANGVLNGEAPLTWESAVNAVMRLVDSLDADADKTYLVQLGS